MCLENAKFSFCSFFKIFNLVKKKKLAYNEKPNACFSRLKSEEKIF